VRYVERAWYHTFTILPQRHVGNLVVLYKGFYQPRQRDSMNTANWW
jgi:hypothetical protein